MAILSHKFWKKFFLSDNFSLIVEIEANQYKAYYR